VPSGNPPSAVAGGYCVIDGTVLMLAGAMGRLGWFRHRPSAVAEDAARAA
jgi:hypothetical protein